MVSCLRVGHAFIELLFFSLSLPFSLSLSLSVSPGFHICLLSVDLGPGSCVPASPSPSPVAKVPLSLCLNPLCSVPATALGQQTKYRFDRKTIKRRTIRYRGHREEGIHSMALEPNTTKRRQQKGRAKTVCWIQECLLNVFFLTDWEGSNSLFWIGGREEDRQIQIPLHTLGVMEKIFRDRHAGAHGRSIDRHTRRWQRDRYRLMGADTRVSEFDRSTFFSLQSTMSMSSEDGEHVYRHSVCIGDTDAYSMVYHSNYLKFFERARTTLLGASLLVDLKAGGLEIAETKLRYIRYVESARYIHI